MTLTVDEYVAALAAMGLTKSRPSYDGAAIYQDRDGSFWSIADPGGLDPDERADYLELLSERMGIPRC